MLSSTFILLLLGAVVLVGLGAAHLVRRTREDWGAVGHDPLVTRPAPLSVQAAAFVGLLLCPVYILPGLLGTVLVLVTLHVTRCRTASCESDVAATLSFLARSLALPVLGVAAPIGLVRASLALLLREANAAARARRTATIHICAGGVLAAFAAVELVSSPHDLLVSMHAVMLCIAPALSAHGLLLRRAASAVDACEDSRSPWATPARDHGADRA